MSNRNRILQRRLVFGAAIVAMMVLGPYALTASAKGNGNSDLNHPEYYEDQGYGTCTKDDAPSDPYSLGTAPSGTHWSLIVLKAGSAQSNDDWNTMIENPTPGVYDHPSGKDLSHVITCTQNGEGGGNSTTTTIASTTTAPGAPCDDYTPSQVAVSPLTVQAGGNVTVTGIAVPGDTITVTLSPGNVVLGSGVASPTGQFSVTGTIPTNSAPGNYTITVSSTLCPASTAITLVVTGTVFSGCGSNSTDRTFVRGTTVQWALHASSFDTSSPVTLRLKKSGYNQVLFNGAWPPGDEATITIPATAPAGNKYTMEQTGTKKNGKGSMTKTCPVWVIEEPSPVSAATGLTVGGDNSSTSGGPLAVGLVLAATFYALLRLSGRRAHASLSRRLGGR